MMRQWRVLVLGLALLAGPASAASLDQIISRSDDLLARVNSFISVMTFSVRSPSVRVPDSRVRIYFKKPDLWKPEPLDGGFTALPQTYRFTIGNVLARMREDHRLDLIRTESVEGRPVHVIRATPHERGAGVRFHTLFVDGRSYVVTRVVTYPTGTDARPSTLTLEYGRFGQEQALLPQRAVFEGQIPRREGRTMRMEPMTATLEFRDYRINVPIADSVFRD